MAFVLATIVLGLSVFIWFVWSADAVQAGANPDNVPNWVLVTGVLIAAAILIFY